MHLEISDFEALANIRRLEVLKMLVNGPKDVKSIANALKISTQAANRHLRILYRSGFIERKAAIRNDTYKLHYIYYISPKGVEILKSIKPQQPSKYANTQSQETQLTQVRKSEHKNLKRDNQQAQKHTS